MSLINDMLRDLEQRGGRSPDIAARVTPAARTSRASRWPLYLLVTLVLALAGALVFVLRSPAPVAATLAAPIEEPATTESPDAAISSPGEAEPVSVSAATPADTVAPEPEHVEAETAVTVVTPLPAPRTMETTPVEPAPEKVSEPAPLADETLIVRRHEPTAAQKAARAARDGFAALRAGDWATAARLLQELLALEPANDEAREGLVVALGRQGRIAEADGVLLDGLAVGAEPSRFAKLRARMQLARGETAAALDSLAVAVPPVAVDPEFHALKAALAQQLEHYSQAAAIYTTLTAFEPGNGTWQAGLGMAQDMQGNNADALVAYERALAAGRLDAALLAHVQRRVVALRQE